jgi:threonine dehydratase
MDPGMLTLDSVKKASERLAGVIRSTPLDYSDTFSKLTGSDLYLKLENMQKTGSFKIRGAYNKICLLTGAECEHGVIAASAGNHAQGVAYAATKAGIKATIVMPEGTPIAKVMAAQGYGAQVVQAGDDYAQAFTQAKILQEKMKATFIHSFDDPEIMAGHGTIALELISELPDLDAIIVPVGGGGLISGIAFTVKYLKPDVLVFGVQTSEAPAAYYSFKEKEMQKHLPGRTIADGINVRQPGAIAFEMINRYVDDLVLVEEEEIAEAIMLLLERSKIVVEGAGAVGLAALLNRRLPVEGKKVVSIISGGNIDANKISIIIERGLVKSGRRLQLNLVIPDQPGSLSKLISLLAGMKANLISIKHDRTKPQIPLQLAEVELVLETRDREHLDYILESLARQGYRPLGL